MQSCPSILRFRSCNSKTALEARSTHVSIEKKPFESRFAQLPTPSGSVNLSGAITICSCEYYSCWKWSGPAHGCLGCKYPPINWVLYTANYFVASCLQHVCLKPIYFIIETPSTRDSRIFFTISNILRGTCHTTSDPRSSTPDQCPTLTTATTFVRRLSSSR